MIRKAEKKDLSRIAEILVFDKRMNYRSIFKNDDYSFHVLQVLDVAKEYAQPEILDHIFVYDDGIVKGLIHLEQTEIAEFYVDHFFQNQGIGAALMEYAKQEHRADHLWVLEKNERAIRFYEAHGFSLSGQRRLEAGTTEYVIKMLAIEGQFEEENRMNKRKGALFLALCLVLAGCGQRAETKTEMAESIGIQNESAMPDTEDADAKDSVSETGETQNTKTTAQEPENEATSEATVENTTEPKYLTLDISTMGEILADGDAVDPIGLTILSEEENGVSWANDWYDSENLSLPMIGTDWNSFYDDHYQYQWVDDELYIYETGTGNCIYVLDYPTDQWYINGNNAYLEDGIFYGASVRNGYAQSNTCFMFAYDLENDKLLWRSADQTYNSMNFVVKGDVILCGYGFTAEPDYLYQINRNTGEVIDRLS